MNQSRHLRMSKLALGLVLAIAAAPSFAQNTSSGVGGQVLGADGQPVAGAEVTIIHVDSGSVSRATTDASGRYNARGLRVGGPYTITVNKAGAGTTSRDEIVLLLDQVSQVNLELRNDLTTLETVTAVASGGSELFSAERMGAGTSISRDQLDEFASVQRNLQDYARLDPRLSQTDKDRGEISVGGQNSRFNSITIDGVATNDTFGLEANNLPTAKQPISIDAIDSVQINVSNYDVTQKGYTGANINAVTKSGTNKFAGSVYYVYRNEDMVGDRFNRTTGGYTPPPEFTEDTKGFTLGGPILKDRLFFFAAYEDLRSSRSTPDFGPLGSSRTNVAITPSSIVGAQTIASSNWGFQAGEVEPSPSELKVTDALIKLDANLGDNHRASFRWSKTEQSDPIFPTFFNNAISLDSHWYSQDKSIETYVGQLFSDWTDNFSTEFKLSYRDYKSEPINNANLPQIRLNFAGALPPGSPPVSSTSAGLVFGTERSRHTNDLATETYNYYGAGNWFLGDHTLKFGFDYDDNDVYNAFLQDTRGNYTFACINTSAALTYQFNGGAALTCNTATRAQNEAAVLENFRRGRPSSYQVQIGAPGFELSDGIAQWEYQNLGLFVQDTWAVNNNLTITAGLRVDQKQMNTSPLFNAAAAAATVPGQLTGSTLPQNGTVVRATGGFGIRNDTTLDGDSLFQPRVGFNYTFDSDRPMQLRGGFGLFEGAAANVWLSNPYSNTGLATRVIGCGIAGFAACPPADGLFNPDPNAQPSSFAGAVPAANVDFLSTNLAQPSVWKLNLAFEHELPFWGMVASIEYLKTDVKDAIYYKHLNLGNPTRQGTDGRDLFWTPQAYNTNCWNNNGSTVTTGACAGFRNRALNNASFNNVVVAERTTQGGGDNLSINFSGKFLENWNWGLGYSFTGATEVSSLSSSVANSSWQSVSIVNANEEVAANSAYLVRDRFVASINGKYNFFGDNATRFGLFYEGRSGKPYSWIYNNDLNGDGSTNDLMYIPTAFGSGEVVFRDLNSNGSGDEEALFWQIVKDNGLNRFAGGNVSRNSSFAPWTNSFDVRVSQEFPGFFKQNKFVMVLDVLNIGNLLNKDWGRIDEVAFQAQGGLARSFVNFQGLDAQGRYIYGVNGEVEDFITRQQKGESQWAAQLTLRYEF